MADNPRPVPKDEPVFKIKATDPLAAEIVRSYAQIKRKVYQMARANAGGISATEKAEVQQLLDLVEDIRNWRRAHKLD